MLYYLPEHHDRPKIFIYILNENNCIDERCIVACRPLSLPITDDIKNESIGTSLRHESL